MRGIGDARLARLQSPAGPEAGAKTPTEIALVAMTGVLAALRGRADASAAAGARGPAEGRPAETAVNAAKTPASAVEATVPAPAIAAAPARAVAAAAPATFVNPVCGIAVSVANPKHVVEFEGVSYYFCCDCCWTSFNANPAKYAAIHHAQLGRVSA
jgi:xanthine dehydrogenase accessory factor